jgi:hypothetical protein
VAILHVLDHLPEAIVQRPGRLWNVFARSLGEQGADGRTALAWRWALTGTCPAPVTLAVPLRRPPLREEMLAEAASDAELAALGSDPGGQVMHARLVLRWLIGGLDAVPLWNAEPLPRVIDGAPSPHNRADIEEAYHRALAACARQPWPGDTGSEHAWRAYGWAYGTRQFLAWACGEEPAGPLSGLCITGRPTLYEMSLDVRRAMTALVHARNERQPTLVGRMAAIMETYLWLVGWDMQPPVDCHGRARFEDCAGP